MRLSKGNKIEKYAWKKSGISKIGMHQFEWSLFSARLLFKFVILCCFDELSAIFVELHNRKAKLKI